MLPSGTLTFLFTDIEGSTRLWELYPEQMQAAMVRHDELIEAAVTQHTGYVVRPRGEGDSRFAVFARPTDALQAAIDIQRQLFAEPWKVPSLRARLAIHTGEAELRDGDYYGNAVNRTARLRSAAHGGQILVSQSTRCLLTENLPADISLRDMGEHTLKNLKQPERIFQVVVPDLPAEFPQLQTQSEHRNNLPLALTKFIGRQREIDELQQLLFQTRLLTIAGTGGAGKTRIATEVAGKVQSSFPDGVWFIDLAPLANTALLSQYMMNILGMREEAGYAPDQTLMDALRTKKMLLILDNCEHLVPEVSLLAEAILHNAPAVRILTTSREKLGVPGEIVWRIPSLSSPDTNQPAILENLMQSEAMQLFQDRAASARSDFKITPENAVAVAQICNRLDGIPLAIELAAARVRVLSVEEIVARLDDRFKLLIGSRTALPRQQTLRALVEWSYDLLNKKERILLRRLSVFAGSWTLQAAEQVCSDDEIESWEVLDLLTSLIDKSFVIGEFQNERERYRFLETIHKFSQEHLLESGESDGFLQKHCSYYLQIVKEAYGKLWGQEQARWLAILDEEYDNLRTALMRLSESPGGEVSLLKMAGSLWKYWEIRGFFSEGRAWLETALSSNPDGPDYWRANGLGGAGHLARQQGDYTQARALHEQSLAIFQAIDHKLGAARQLVALGDIARFLGDYSRSTELYEQSLAIRYEINDQEGIAVSLRQMAVTARDHGHYQEARERLEQSLKIESLLGDKLLMAQSLDDLGLVAYHLCEYEKAVSIFEQAMALQKELNDRLGISNTLQNLGNVAKDQGDFKRAEQLVRECLTLKMTLGDKRGITGATATLAEVAFLQGKYPLAADFAGQSLKLSQELGVKRGEFTSTLLLGYIDFYQGDYPRAASLAEECLALATNIQTPLGYGYAKILGGLIKYSEGDLETAREMCQEALDNFEQLNDRRSMANAWVNLARIAYRQGDRNAGMNYLEQSLSVSQELNTRWNLGFVLEIMGLLQRSDGNYARALELFQESLSLSVEQDNQQGIANCLGALAGMAVLAKEAKRAARLFAAAANLRREMGARMSSSDRIEYEKYLTKVHEQLDHTTFEEEWSEGFTMTAEQVIEDLKEWSGKFVAASVF